jgi:hypothetical protein
MMTDVEQMDSLDKYELSEIWSLKAQFERDNSTDNGSLSIDKNEVRSEELSDILLDHASGQNSNTGSDKLDDVFVLKAEDGT